MVPVSEFLMSLSKLLNSSRLRLHVIHVQKTDQYICVRLNIGLIIYVLNRCFWHLCDETLMYKLELRQILCMGISSGVFLRCLPIKARMCRTILRGDKLNYQIVAKEAF